MRLLFSCLPEIGSLDGRTHLARAYGLINAVLTGVERLYADRLLTGKILHLQDSWTGLYRVPEQ